MTIDISHQYEEDKKQPVMMTLNNFHGQLWLNPELTNANQLTLFLTEADASKISVQLGFTLQDIDKIKGGETNA